MKNAFKESGRAADLIADLHAYFTHLDTGHYTNDEQKQSRLHTM